MRELIYKDHLEKIERLLTQWNSACRAALEHNTPDNNRAADVLGNVLAGYVRPLVITLQEIRNRSDIGELFDGHDELNEDTHEANEKLLTGALDTINKLTRGVYDDGDDGLLTCSVCQDRYTTNADGVCSHCKHQAWLDANA